MNELPVPKIKTRDRDIVITALRAGVVPSVGLQHIQVGRQRELEAVIKDIDRIRAGASCIRFITGDYGSGKTFVLSTVCEIARQQNLVIGRADLAPGRRLFSTQGQAKMLYGQIAKSLETRHRRDQSTLNGIVEVFLQPCIEAARDGGKDPLSVVSNRLGEIRQMADGDAFATVLVEYARAYLEGDFQRQDCAMRWLRAEYSTRSDAYRDLGVRTIIDDASFYKALYLMARFVRLAGYGGLIVCIDEMDILYKIQQPQSRNQNFEQLLHIYNDVLGGRTEGLGLFLGGTPNFLTDPRRGLFSCPAFQSRLSSSLFIRNDLVDYSGPVITLSSLTVEELYHLLERIRDVFAYGDRQKWLVPDEALHAFLQCCLRTLGNECFQSPRNAVKAFVEMLAVLEQYPAKRWSDILGSVNVDRDPAAGSIDPDDDLIQL